MNFRNEVSCCIFAVPKSVIDVKVVVSMIEVVIEVMLSLTKKEHACVD